MSGSSFQSSKETPRVLVVEDEPVILLDLVLATRADGAEVIQATSASRALEILNDTPVDAAVLDVNLGGGQTCRAIAERLKSEGVPFVIHSGDLDRQGEVIRELGAPVVPKPAPGEDVAEAVMALVR